MVNEAHCQSPVPGSVAFRLAVVLLQLRLHLISVIIAGIFIIHGFVIFQLFAPKKNTTFVNIFSTWRQNVIHSQYVCLTCQIFSTRDRLQNQLSSRSRKGGLDAHPRTEPRLAWSAEKFPPSGATPVPCTVVMETPLVSPYYYYQYLLVGVAAPSRVVRP